MTGLERWSCDWIREVVVMMLKVVIYCPCLLIFREDPGVKLSPRQSMRKRRISDRETCDKDRSSPGSG